jgi:hypothetical protein
MRNHVAPRPRPGESPPRPVNTALVDAVRAELTIAGRLDSAPGQRALRLAVAMCEFGITGGGLAALSKELRATMAEALQNAATANDPLDELRARRDRKVLG